MARPLWLRLFSPDSPTTVSEFREALRDAPFGDGEFFANLRVILDLPSTPDRPDRPDRDSRHDVSARDWQLFPGTINTDPAAGQQALADQQPAVEAAGRTDLFDAALVPLPAIWESRSAPFVRMDNDLCLSFVRDMELGPVPDAHFKGLRHGGNGQGREIFQGPNDSPDGSHLTAQGAPPADLPPPPDLFF